MNKIFKVIYSKTRHCYVVVSELAKSHCKTAGSHTARSKTALTAAVLLALGTFSFLGMPTAQAEESVKNNDYVGANSTYWYWDTKTNTWKTYDYKLGDAFNNRSFKELPNYNGGGAKLPGAITAGLYAQAGQQTITIGDRNAGQSKGSVFIGEHSGYNDGGDNKPSGTSLHNNYVTAVGFESDATGWGSIAIGSNAIAENTNTKNKNRVVNEVGEIGNPKTVSDDVYGIESNPSIEGASVALGYNAHAKDGNIAIGAYSQATEDSSTPYVSVGGTMTNADGSTTPIQRRITNVADGTADTDVATVGQMNKAIESVGATGWTLSTNGSTSGTTIKSGTKVDFSPAVDGKNGTAGHSNVAVSNTGSNVKIGLNKDIVLGETTKDNGGSLNVYSDSSDSNNISNHVKITGSTISVNYPKANTDGTTTDTRGVIIGVGEDSKGNADGYIAFNNATGAHTYLHSATDAPKDLQDRLKYKWNDVQKKSTQKKYIANLDDGITFTGDVNGKVPEGYTQTPTKLNTTLNIMGGAKTTDDLTSGNIGVVSTPAAEKEDGTTQASKLEIKLNKDLKGITSITSQSTTNSTGAKIELGENGTTISGGNVNISKNKVTGLKAGDVNKGSTDAITGGQLYEEQQAREKAISDAKTKYYSVDGTLSALLGENLTNEKNDGAKGMGSMAAGFNTHADGILSTVAGSYSGVINADGTSGLNGATALSYGTFNINQNTDTSKLVSGVANSIIGQANVTENSNAAIIYGAGNTVTNSYRDITVPSESEVDLGKVKADIKKNDMAAVIKDLQTAVPQSGGQVMVMGGGNNVESAYMTQVVGVGNTVKGNQVQNAQSEWVTDASIKGYDKDESSQYNYVDGFSNEVINGKHDYVIGANNKLSGDSYDDSKAQPIKRSNRSNIVIGDNHTLTREQNTVIIGSSDTENTQTKARDAVIIGHNANATNDTGADNAVAIGRSANATGGNAVTIGVNTSAGANSITIGSESSAYPGSNIAIGRSVQVYGYNITNAVALGVNTKALVSDGVAIGSESQAKVKGNSVEGYDPATGNNSEDATATWKATKGAVSIGNADGKVTRQINGLAAGTNDTDAVNVAQLKKLEGMKANVNASNIGKNLKGADGKTASTEEITANENAWGTAIGTGEIAKDNGQLVTGKTVYAYNTPVAEAGKNLNYVSADKTTGQNLATLDEHVKTNADAIGTNTTNITKNAGDITNLKNLSNITDEGRTVIKNLSKDAVKVAAGDRVTVTPTEDKETGTITYKVSAKNDGKVAVGDQNLVSGDTVNTAINNAITNAGTATDTKLAGKANVDASNIGANLKGADGKAASAEAQKANAEKWGSAIGTGEIKADDGRMVTGKTVYDEVRPKEDGNYVKKNKTTGENLSALDSKIGKLDKDGNYIKKDDSISKNLSTLDTQVKNNADAIQKNSESIQNITNNVKNLSDNAVQYDKDSNKTKVTLGGEGGTTITHVKDGALSENSSDAVNGKQLYNEQQAREKADAEINQKVTNNTNEITKIENGEGFTDAGKTVIKNLSKDAVQVKAGDDHITVDAKTDETTGNKTYTISAKDGKVASGDTGLISGGTLYNEVHVDKDGSYIKSGNTVGNNLSALDTGLKTTSDLIHTNATGDTIQIGGNSTATKIDVSGKDAKGNTTGRVITGVITDASDRNSAANVGYVEANTQQIYREMNNAYGNLNRNINRAAAGSNALAALHPLDYDPADKASFAVGYGHYRNANAAAIGAFYYPNANTMVNVGVSVGNGDPGINAGVSFKLGQGSAYNGVSKAEMAQTIHDQAAEISTIKANDAAKDKRIDALEKENQEMKKQIQEILARLNG